MRGIRKLRVLRNEEAGEVSVGRSHEVCVDGLEVLVAGDDDLRSGDAVEGVSGDGSEVGGVTDLDRAEDAAIVDLDREVRVRNGLASQPVALKTKFLRAFCRRTENCERSYCKIELTISLCKGHKGREENRLEQRSHHLEVLSVTNPVPCLSLQLIFADLCERATLLQKRDMRRYGSSCLIIVKRNP